MGSRLVAVIALACTVTCAASPSALVPGWRSGSRLRAYVWRTEDGTAGFTGSGRWFDQELGADCTFMLDPAGMPRCFTGGSWSRVYLDTGCTEPALVVRPDTDVPSHVLSCAFSRGHCEEPLFPGACDVLIPDTADPRAGPVYSETSGSCAEMATLLDARIFPLAPGDPTMFVAASVERESLGRLEQEVLVAEDGARRRLRLLDTSRATRCRMELTDVDGVAACVPERHANVGVDGRRYSSDASCATAVVPSDYGAACPPPLVALERRFDCDSRVELREIGPLVPAPIFERPADGGSCVERRASTWPYHEIGELIPNSAFAHAIASLLGTAEARFRVLTVNGVVVDELGLADRDGAPCRPTQFVDGVTRCLPDSAVAVDFAYWYVDPDCSIGAYEDGTTRCPTPTTLGFRDAFDGTGQLSELFLLAAPSTSARFIRDGDVCVPFTPEFPDDWIIVERIGLDAVPRVTLEVE